MAKIVSIGTSTPPFAHKQEDILQFMRKAYALDGGERRKLSFLYHHSGIDTRYSVLPYFSMFGESGSAVGLPMGESVDEKMKLYKEFAPKLAIEAVLDCISGHIGTRDITHLITVSCTGMYAPGLDIELVEMLGLVDDVYRTSVNFMGCYAAIHAMKLGNAICCENPRAKVVIVAVELCTLHFQLSPTADNISSSLLFGDGCAALLMCGDEKMRDRAGWYINSFYSLLSTKGKGEMGWGIGKDGFLMRLSGRIPELIEEDIDCLVVNSLRRADCSFESIKHWCIHPGGRKIVDVVQKKLGLANGQVVHSRGVLRDYGNMSSPTILYVLKRIIEGDCGSEPSAVFGVAFGPGLTMETFIAEKY